MINDLINNPKYFSITSTPCVGERLGRLAGNDSPLEYSMIWDNCAFLTNINLNRTE